MNDEQRKKFVKHLDQIVALLEPNRLVEDFIDNRPMVDAVLRDLRDELVDEAIKGVRYRLRAKCPRCHVQGLAVYGVNDMVIAKWPAAKHSNDSWAVCPNPECANAKGVPYILSR